MQIVIQTSLSMAAQLRKEGAIETQLGDVKITPLHPGTRDEELETWFFAEVQDALVAATITMLHETGLVRAAYAKPQAQPA